MSDTLTTEQASLIAGIAASLAGGRFASRVTDETIRAEAEAIVMPRRAERRRKLSAARQAGKRQRVAAARAQRLAWLAEWSDYSADDMARIEQVHAFMSYAPKREALRRIARRLFRAEAPAHTDDRACACVDCLDVSDWRAMVRRNAAVRTYVTTTGNVGISRFDMTPGADSRFFKSVVKHWHQYTGGKHGSVAIHGVSPEDVFQDGMVRALEANDTDADGIPLYAPLFGHMRQAVEASVYLYRYGHSHSEAFTTWTWQDWQSWASERIDPAFRVRYSSEAEWKAYAAAEAAESLRARRAEREESARMDRAESLEEARRLMAQFILSGGTVRKLENLLNLKAETITDNLTKRHDAPTVTFVSEHVLPVIDGGDYSRPVTPEPARRYDVEPLPNVSGSVLAQGSGFTR